LQRNVIFFIPDIICELLVLDLDSIGTVFSTMQLNEVIPAKDQLLGLRPVSLKFARKQAPSLVPFLVVEQAPKPTCNSSCFFIYSTHSLTPIT
jgi:hypothetical protein